MSTGTNSSPGPTGKKVGMGRASGVDQLALNHESLEISRFVLGASSDMSRPTAMWRLIRSLDSPQPRNQVAIQPLMRTFCCLLHMY